MNEKYEVVKFTNNGVELDVNFSPEEETLWLTQSEISKLYGVDRTRVTRHINNIFNSDELEEKRNVRKTHFANSYKPVNLYNLDVILAIGYRIDSKKGIQFRKWANKILKEYMLRGYVINEERTLVTNENYVNLINKVEKIDNRVISLENKINSKDIPLEKIFYNGEVYDAYEIIQTIFRDAKEEIIIIDNYVDRSILDRLKYKERNVLINIYCNYNTSRINQSAINTFNIQYGGLNIHNTNKIHDRFIIIDNKVLYHLGASIKDAGKKVFAINKMASSLINYLLSSL